MSFGGNYGATMTDSELLRAYVEEGSEDAFAALAGRYVNLVYSAAVRQCNDSEAARDIAQAVFLTLARKAATLSRETILSGWLYRTARFVALEYARQEMRRRRREETMEIDDATNPSDLWQMAAPCIDAAMEGLGEKDRTAIVLRFFQGLSLREVGTNLGLSEEAAKKRVARGIERLRQQLKRQGVTSSSSLLSAALAAHAIQSAPSAVAAAVATTTAGGAVSTLATGALHLMVMTKAKTLAACAATALLMTGTATVSIQHANSARENSELRAVAVAAPIAAQDQGDVVAAANENRELQKQSLALHRLRGEVSQLRQAVVAQPANGKVSLQSAPPRFRDAANTLRELQFEQFIAAGRKAILDQPLPKEEQEKYIPEVAFLKELGLALRVYASRNGDAFPVSLDELMASEQVSDSMREKLREGKYEYHVFANAEQKPGLPAAWWRGPDERGIRMLVLNDGSSHMIREPAGVEAPGTLNMGGAR